MKLRILEPAEQDLIRAFYFYEGQEEGVGQYFLDCLSSDIDSLLLYAGIHQKKFEVFYWLLSKRFPFAVYYTIECYVVLVHAVLDCRQDPIGIEDRLSGK